MHFSHYRVKNFSIVKFAGEWHIKKGEIMLETHIFDAMNRCEEYLNQTAGESNINDAIK